MYCKYCKIEVESSLTTCPLCKNKLEGEPLDIPVFLPRKPRKKHFPTSFTGLYFYIMISITLVCIAVNALVPSEYVWSLMAFLTLLYVYTTLKHTVLYKGSGGSKIFTQTLALSVLFISAQYIFKMPEWAFSYGIPAVVISSLLMQTLFVSIYHKKSNGYVRYITYTSLIGFIPIIIDAFTHFDFSILADVCALISAVAFLGVMLLAGKTVLAEMNKKGHF